MIASSVNCSIFSLDDWFFRQHSPPPGCRPQFTGKWLYSHLRTLHNASFVTHLTGFDITTMLCVYILVCLSDFRNSYHMSDADEILASIADGFHYLPCCTRVQHHLYEFCCPLEETLIARSILLSNQSTTRLVVCTNGRFYREAYY